MSSKINELVRLPFPRLIVSTLMHFQNRLFPLSFASKTHCFPFYKTWRDQQEKRKSPNALTWAALSFGGTSYLVKIFFSCLLSLCARSAQYDHYASLALEPTWQASQCGSAYGEKQSYSTSLASSTKLRLCCNSMAFLRRRVSRAPSIVLGIRLT